MKIYNYFKNMSQEFRFKNTNETRNYLLEEIALKELMSRKHRKFCTNLKFIEYFLILTSSITGYYLNSYF